MINSTLLAVKGSLGLFNDRISRQEQQIANVTSLLAKEVIKLEENDATDMSNVKSKLTSETSQAPQSGSDSQSSQEVKTQSPLNTIAPSELPQIGGKSIGNSNLSS